MFNGNKISFVLASQEIEDCCGYSGCEYTKDIDYELEVGSTEWDACEFDLEGNIEFIRVQDLVLDGVTINFPGLMLVDNDKMRISIPKLREEFNKVQTCESCSEDYFDDMYDKVTIPYGSDVLAKKFTFETFNPAEFLDEYGSREFIDFDFKGIFVIREVVR